MIGPSGRTLTSEPIMNGILGPFEAMVKKGENRTFASACTKVCYADESAVHCIFAKVRFGKLPYRVGSTKLL